HPFTLTPLPRRFALCCTFPIRSAGSVELIDRPTTRTVGVTHHRALWSPDFPPRRVARPRRTETKAAAAIITVRRDPLFHHRESPLHPQDEIQHELVRFGRIIGSRLTRRRPGSRTASNSSWRSF